MRLPPLGLASSTRSLNGHITICCLGITAVRLKVEENQLVDVFGEIGFHIDGLEGA